jgi:transposase
VALAVYDHAEERVWRHLDSCQFMTYLHARAPRVNCPGHGVRQARLPWAQARSRFTSLFERLAIDVLLATDVTGATRILRISWDEAWSMMERAVARGR